MVNRWLWLFYALAKLRHMRSTSGLAEKRDKIKATFYNFNDQFVAMS